MPTLPASISGNVQLGEGVYTGSGRIAAHGTRLTGVKGKTIVKGTISATDKDNVIIQGINFDGTGLGLVDAALKIYDCNNWLLADLLVYNFTGNGASIQGVSGTSYDM